MDVDDACPLCNHTVYLLTEKRDVMSVEVPGS